jgi:outer membrane lipase/esterase
VNLIGQLRAAGARTIIVFNLPDLGLTVSAREGGPSTQATLTILSSNYNNVLNNGLAGIGTGVVPVNTFALIREIIASPQSFGVANVTNRACTTSSAFNCTPATLVTPNAATTYLFADGIHPTTGAHAALAQAVVSELTAPQQMSVLAETPLAFLAAHRAAVSSELMLDTIAPGEGARVFATGSFGRRTLRGDVDAPRARSDDSLVTIGVDWRRGASVSVGAALTGGHSKADLQDHAGGFKTDELIASLFGQYHSPGGLYLNGLAGFGSADYRDVERAFSLGAARRNERSRGSGNDLTVSGAAGYWFGLGGLRTGPFAAVSYDRIRVEHMFETSGDSTAMSFRPQLREALIGKLGWKLQGVCDLGGAALYPTAAVAWAHDDKAEQRFVTAGLTSMSGEFSMPGYTPDRNWGEAEVGLNARFTDKLGGFVAYQARFSGRTRDNAGTVGLKYSF